MEPRDYGPFPYVPINNRPVLKWPNGARIAVWIIPNIEVFPLSVGIPGTPYDTRVPPAPSVRAWAQRDYGNRVGIWRIMEVLQKHKIRASPTLNSDICDHHPEIVRAAVELGWEILATTKPIRAGCPRWSRTRNGSRSPECSPRSPR
jgi:peptidoglycan/xylan/chitin deacetylase (PgdA/CDA1 family)